MTTPKENRSGFTLIEILVVIAIITIIIAILLPAVQSARESSRRSSCQNNLKQIGLAAQLYHDTYKVFPHGFDNQYCGHAWGSFLLPFLEQIALHKEVNPDGNGYPLPIVVGDPESTIVPVYLCPSSTITRDAGELYRGYLGRSSYVGSSGPYYGASLDQPGVFYKLSDTNIAKITDGLSNTFLFGEVEERDYPFDNAPTWVGPFGRVAQAVRRTDSSTRLNSGTGTFGSRHRNGAQFVYADGSVHFVQDEIQAENDTSPHMSAFQRLGHKSDE